MCDLCHFECQILVLHLSKPNSADGGAMLQRIGTRQSLSVAMINTGCIRYTSKKSRCKSSYKYNYNHIKEITL